jgi:hypothetical protein
MSRLCITYTRSLYSVCVALFFATLVCAQGNPDGHWEGTLKTDNREIGISLDIAKNAKSEWNASMGLPSENMTGLVVNDIAVNDKSVKFVAVEFMMAKVDLTLEPDGSMKGTITTPQGPGPAPIEFKRTGEAKVALIPVSPAVSKGLEGDWEGSLQMPNRAVRIIFHFKNQPNKTVAATIDTPDSGGMGLPLNDVKQTGQKVELGIKIAHARFQGTLNPECTELAGQFSHEENQAPLTLRKK